MTPLPPQVPEDAGSDRALGVVASAAICAGSRPALFGTIATPSYDGESERHARLSAAAALSDVVEPSDLRQLQPAARTSFEAPVGTPTTQRHAPPTPSSVRRSASESCTPGRRAGSVSGERFSRPSSDSAAFSHTPIRARAAINRRWASMGYDVPKHQLPRTTVESAIVKPPAGRSRGFARGRDRRSSAAAPVGEWLRLDSPSSATTCWFLRPARTSPRRKCLRNELDAFDQLYLDHGMSASKDLGVAILAGAALGGGTLVNWTTCFEPPDWLRASSWATDEGLEGFDSADTGCRHRTPSTGADVQPTAIDRSQGPGDPRWRGCAGLGGSVRSATRSTAGIAVPADLAAGGAAKLSSQRLHLADGCASRAGGFCSPGVRVDRVDFHNGVLDSVEGVLTGRSAGFGQGATRRARGRRPANSDDPG